MGFGFGLLCYQKNSWNFDIIFVGMYYVLTWNNFFSHMKAALWNLLQNNIHPFLLLFCFLSSSVILDAPEWDPNFLTFSLLLLKHHGHQFLVNCFDEEQYFQTLKIYHQKGGFHIKQCGIFGTILIANRQ